MLGYFIMQLLEGEECNIYKTAHHAEEVWLTCFFTFCYLDAIQPNTLFRGNSLDAKLFKYFSLVVSAHYLWEVLAPYIWEIQRDGKNHLSSESNVFNS